MRAERREVLCKVEKPNCYWLRWLSNEVPTADAYVYFHQWAYIKRPRQLTNSQRGQTHSTKEV